MKTVLSISVLSAAASLGLATSALAQASQTLAIARCSEADEVGTKVFELDALVDANRKLISLSGRQLDGSGHGIYFSATLDAVSKELESRTLSLGDLKMDSRTLPADRTNFPKALTVQLITGEPYAALVRNESANAATLHMNCAAFTNTDVLVPKGREASNLTGDEQAEVVETLVSGASDAHIVNAEEVRAKLGYETSLTKLVSAEVAQTAVRAHARLLHVLEKRVVANCAAPYLVTANGSERVCRVSFETTSQVGRAPQTNTVSFQFVAARSNGEALAIKDGRVRVLFATR